MNARIVPALAAIALAASALPAAADQTVQRHLVYNFTVGVQNDTHDTDASSKMSNIGGGANNNGTGDTSYMGVASDKGTITVDVYGVEPDGGLIVKVSENGQNTRKAAAVECVVYPTTNSICASGEVFPEELAVIRTLSPKFFDPSALDANRHWHQGSAAAGIALDFTVGTPSGDGRADQRERRREGCRRPETARCTAPPHTATTWAKNVSTQLKEYDTIRKQMGAGQYSNIIIDITAQLATDSQTAAKS